MAVGEDAVGDEFNQFEQSYWCASVPGVTYAVSSNGDPCLVGIFFMGPVLAHNLGVRNFVAAVAWDIFISDDPKSVSSLNLLLFGDFRYLTYALAQAYQFIWIQLVPSHRVFGVAS